MDIRRTFPVTIVVPVILAVLVSSAWAAPAVRKTSHYPGQACSGCHKVEGAPTGRAIGGMPAGSKTVPPAKGATPSR